MLGDAAPSSRPISCAHGRIVQEPIDRASEGFRRAGLNRDSRFAINRNERHAGRQSRIDHRFPASHRFELDNPERLSPIQ